MRKLMVAVSLAVGLLLAFTGSASAQDDDDYGSVSELFLSAASITCGQTETITGTNFLPNAQVTLSYNPVIGTTTTDAEGAFTFSWPTPSTLSGPVTITATDGTNTATATLTATCTTGGGGGAGGGGAGGGGGGAGSGSLPTTGSDLTEPLLRGGLVLLTVGGILVFGAQKRRSRSIRPS